eukprot:CAMPEP_0114272028 /NCGR_PEP_ID=MMETSP0058-20121206/28201_1 /TAXON_ID=36894 /ORGANISM="Pyramimonas parkeae, CCMP726" /LENGTH=70 /DNA_ID=CAMNT_0001391101 /DNA_START=238 /DNA_END=450 /DNA_ORIENTATION=+
MIFKAQAKLGNWSGQKSRILASPLCCSESPTAHPGPPVGVHIGGQRMLRRLPTLELPQQTRAPRWQDPAL